MDAHAGDYNHCLSDELQPCMLICRGQRIALDIAVGLRYLHDHDIVHLDLKSPNVLLNGNGQAKLSDVGLARMLVTRTHLSTLPGGIACTAASCIVSVPGKAF